MKDQNQFKSELQRAAYQEEITPPASVWKKLVTSIPPKIKRSTSPWRLSLLLLLLLIVMTAAILRLNEPKLIGAFELYAESNNHMVRSLQVDQNDQSKELSNTTNQDKTTVSNNNKEESNSRVSQNKPKGDNTKTNINRVIQTPLTMKARDEKTTSPTSYINYGDTRSSQPSETLVKTQEKSTLNQTSSEKEGETNLNVPTIYSELKEISQSLGKTIQSENQINPLPILLGTPLESLQQNQYIRKTIPEINPKAETKILRMYTDAYAGGGWATRRLSALESEMSSYLNLRENSERDLSYFESGIRMGLMARRWHFEVGLQYGQINAYMQHTYMGIKQMTTVLVMDPTGLTRVDSVLRFGTRERIVRNTYRDISIPLRVGYQLYQGRIGLTAYVGVNPVFGLQPQGIILRPDESDYPLEADPESWFNRGMRWYGTAQIQLSLPVFDNVAFILDMGVIHDFNGIQTDQNPIEQSYNMLRGSAGVRYFFNHQATKHPF